MTEYEQRLSKAYGAKTYDELDRLSADLPGAMTTGRRGGPCRPAPSTLLMAIMSGFERRGRWNVPRKLTTFALWGGGVVDLRYADFTSPEVDIRYVLDHGRPDDPGAAGGKRRNARSRRDGYLRPS